MRNRADVGASLFLILLGIVVAIGAVVLGIGTAEQLRPGFLPFLCGVALAVLSSFFFLKAWRGRTVGTQPLGQWRRPITVLTGLMVYVVILDPVGYVIATALLAVIILRVFDMKTKWVLVATSLGIAVATYALFNLLLGVELPAGVLTVLRR